MGLNWAPRPYRAAKLTCPMPRRPRPIARSSIRAQNWAGFAPCSRNRMPNLWPGPRRPFTIASAPTRYRRTSASAPTRCRRTSRLWLGRRLGGRLGSCAARSTARLKLQGSSAVASSSCGGPPRFSFSAAWLSGAVCKGGRKDDCRDIEVCRARRTCPFPLPSTAQV